MVSGNQVFGGSGGTGGAGGSGGAGGTVLGVGINAGPYPNVTFSGDTVSNNSGFGGSGGGREGPARRRWRRGRVTGHGIAIDGGNTSALISDSTISG